MRQRGRGVRSVFGAPESVVGVQAQQGGLVDDEGGEGGEVVERAQGVPGEGAGGAAGGVDACFEPTAARGAQGQFAECVFCGLQGVEELGPGEVVVAEVGFLTAHV